MYYYFHYSEHIIRFTGILWKNLPTSMIWIAPKLHGEQLIAFPGVRQIRSFFVMKEVTDNAGLDFQG